MTVISFCLLRRQEEEFVELASLVPLSLFLVSMPFVFRLFQSYDLLEDIVCA